jgi:hypothetical protein
MEVRGQLHNPRKEPPILTRLRIESQPSSLYHVTTPTDLSWLWSVELFMIEFISFLSRMEVVLARINK